MNLKTSPKEFRFFCHKKGMSFDKGNYYLHCKNYLIGIYGPDCEIVGNIFENPELMKVKL